MLGLNNVTGTCLQILSVAIHHSITSIDVRYAAIVRLTSGPKFHCISLSSCQSVCSMKLSAKEFANRFLGVLCFETIWFC